VNVISDFGFSILDWAAAPQFNPKSKI